MGMDVKTDNDVMTEYVVEAENTTEMHSTAEESDFLRSLDDDFEPQAIPSQTDQKVELEAAAALASGGLMAVEGGLKMMLHPDFAFDAKQTQNVAEKVAPLVLKYGANPPEWVKEYMQEIIAAFAIGSLAFGSVMQVRQLKLADEEKAQKEQGDSQGGEAEKEAA